MSVLENKTISAYDYSSRYNLVPYYFDTRDGKYFRGLTKNLNKEAQYLIHVVTQTDTLDSLSFKYYGRPDLYWIIANFNNVQDCFESLYKKYNYLYIPNYSDVRFV